MYMYACTYLINTIYVCFIDVYLHTCIRVSILIKFIDVACKVFQIFMKFIL